MASDSDADVLVKVVLAIVAVVVLVPLLMMALAIPMLGLMGMGFAGGMTGGFSPFWGVGMMALWVALLAGIGYAVYRVIKSPSSDRDPALEELRVAYARGDLSRDEFEERRERLRADN